MNKQKYFMSFIVSASILFFFSSCGGGASGGAIFSAIEGEVKLGKKTATWAITSMVCYKGNLYCTNGNKIYTKGLNAGRGWSAMSTQYDGAIARLAADDSNLYVMSYKPSVEVTSSNQDSYDYSDISLNVLYGPSTGVVNLDKVMAIFDNKVYPPDGNNNTTGREAYATVYGGTTYKLNGTAAPTASGSSDIASAVKVGGSTELYQTFISTSDYTNTRAWYVPLTGNESSFTASNKAQFIIQGVGAGAPSFNLSTDLNEALTEAKHGKISGLAYYKENDGSGEKEYLLVSTSGSGYHRITLDGTNVITHNPHPNGEQLAGMGIIEGAFWTTPNGAIYAGITTADKSRYGLWSYFPDGAWNVD